MIWRKAAGSAKGDFPKTGVEINISFKNERFHGVRHATRTEMKAASFEYFEVFYKRTRQCSALNFQSRI